MGYRTSISHRTRRGRRARDRPDWHGGRSRGRHVDGAGVVFLVAGDDDGGDGAAAGRDAVVVFHDVDGGRAGGVRVAEHVDIAAGAGSRGEGGGAEPRGHDADVDFGGEGGVFGGGDGAVVVGVEG